ncbi:MAG: OmpA family protein [Candidatus Krumholzibacteriia bacterium]|nr:OmpA family protein [bacterium]MCB9515192.1 OmpA family protein [Candidatus Latescibacterota bacterium]
MPRKKGDDAPPPGAPAWMATFGDMMSLLLTFFILLVSFSSIQETKFREAVGSLQGALGVLTKLPKVPVADEIELPTMRGKDRSDELQQRTEELRRHLQALKQADTVTVSRTAEGLAIRLEDEMLFKPGQAVLETRSYPVLDVVAATLASYPNPVRVEGHTDNRPIESERFPSNWELSAARAASVLRYFERSGLDPRRLSAVGLGEWSPVAKNDSEAERAKNRRVEIFMELPLPQGIPQTDRLGEHF